MYPLVLDLAAGGMPLAVTSTTCATLTKTWLIEDGIPEIAQARRLGHRLGGVRGIYSRVTEPMINDLIDALQRRWKNTRPDGPESRVRRLRPVA